MNCSVLIAMDINSSDILNKCILVNFPLKVVDSILFPRSYHNLIPSEKCQWLLPHTFSKFLMMASKIVYLSCRELNS